ncbi:MAG: SMC-Scp complex subunit ScpB [Candidatus Hydrogenedens sp.]|nr:SMC-Scp complex subunit ScpB [Candidatus Hydrogenedens sp.]
MTPGMSDAPETEEEFEEAEQGELDGVSPAESLDRGELVRVLYGLLFACDRPIGVGRIAEVFGDIDKEVIQNVLTELAEQINGQESLPYMLREIAGGYQLVSKSELAPWIRRLLNAKRSKRLSKAVLETLAIIAYKQPCTRAEVESIRGVSVSHAFEQLQERKLIKIAGIADLPGRPKLYRTSDEFLEQFGLKNLKELPTLEELQGTRP